MMNLHLHAIGKAADPGSHATVLRDGAGYHKSRRLRVPANITLVPLPHYAPELNCAENIWKHPRKNKLANTGFDGIADKACEAWPSSQPIPKPSQHPQSENGPRAPNPG